jgi:DMSO/TMAO reductase YedYZ molybdopterin-dependent catalytic subunit
MKIMQKWNNSLLIAMLVMCLSLLFTSCQPKSAEHESNETDTEEIFTGNSTVVHKSGVTLVITPIEEMGITGQVQDVDIIKYRLTVTGLVNKPISLSYEDILSYDSITEIAVLNCPEFFVDVGVWTGVPLMTIFDEAGIKSEANQVIFHAVDGYSRTLSLEHIYSHTVFLAYKVNGQTLPPEHGFPLRVVDESSDGNIWVKWLHQVEIK